MDLSPGLSAEGDTYSGVPAAPSVLASLEPVGGKGDLPLERGHSMPMRRPSYPTVPTEKDKDPTLTEMGDESLAPLPCISSLLKPQEGGSQV